MTTRRRRRAAAGGESRRRPGCRATERRWLRGDVVAGAVVAALAVPQALGYASIAGAPVQVGLYAVPVALVAYAVFGSSRQLVVGPVSTVSVLSGSFLASFGVAGTAQAASYTAALALGSGLVLVAAGFVADRLGGGVPVQADRHRLRPRPDDPGHPQRGAPPARGPDAAGTGGRAGGRPGREPHPRRRRPDDGDRLGGLAAGALRRPAGWRRRCRGGCWCWSAAWPPRRHWTCGRGASRSSARSRAGCRRPGCRRSTPATWPACSPPARRSPWWVWRRG